MTNYREIVEKMEAIEPYQIVEIAESKGRDFKLIKTHQIRNFYSEITAMKNEVQMAGSKGALDESKLRMQLMLLKPKLAYAAGRQGKNGSVMQFYEFITAVIEGVNQAQGEAFRQALHNFFHLMESLVAYHKFFGGE